MSPYVFTWMLFAGAAAIALWIVVRFPESGPRSGRGISMALGAAILAFVAMPSAVMFVGGLASAVAAALLVVLPGGICILLAIAWMMLGVIRLIQPHVR